MKFKNHSKKNCSFFACLIITATLAVPTLSSAATYYVSTNGNDSNAGSQAAPFRKIKFALGQLVAGDTLFIRGGTYSELLESHNGTNFPSGISWQNPVTIAAFPGEQVTLIGNMSIGIERPLTQYVIFDGISIDAKGLESGISINGGSHHIRFINGEVKNAIGYAGINTSYNNDANPGGNVFNEFINMHVHHNGIRRGLDHGFYIKTSGIIIEYCNIHDNAAAGIHHFTPVEQPRVNNNIYRNNLIYNNGIVDSGGVGITINRGDNNIIYNNVLWGNTNGIHINYIGNPVGTKVYNNTIYGNQVNGIAVLTGAKDTQVFNNISYKNSANLHNEGINTSISKNITTNPLFVDVATADFHLQAGSTDALDKGIPLEEVKTDRDGITRSPVSPDIGAYEYNLISEAPKNLRLVTK